MGQSGQGDRRSEPAFRYRDLNSIPPLHAALGLRDGITRNNFAAGARRETMGARRSSADSFAVSADELI
jgi:hypothetical protein